MRKQNRKKTCFILKYILCPALIGSLITTAIPTTSLSYGEVETDGEITTADETRALPGYNDWLTAWQSVSAESTANMILTPGSTPADLNFAWYSVDAGTPAVMVSTDKTMAGAITVEGTSTAIQRSNGAITFYSANHVSVKNYFSPGTTYYYSYADDITEPVVKWSDPKPYTPRRTDAYSVILTADPQIGASTYIPADTYNWNRTLERAVKLSPDAAFVLTAGDQIDFKKETDDDNLRESEYAGLLYPPLLRSLPLVAVIGNHDTRVGDFQYHFNNPNSSGNHGTTPAGCDYYFRYGDVLYMILNSNSRDTASHRNLMAQAVKENADARWRVVSFHHDVYGSGAAHSNRTSANMRILFAPLMDEFCVDLVISGHDHSYTRSYPMLDGTAIDYGNGNTSLTDPVGTSYISLGTATGCKMFSLANPKQFYVSERSNTPIPTFSILDVAGNRLTVKTYDYNGEKYADDFTITKTAPKTNPLSTIEGAKKITKTGYTISSFNQLQSALKNFQKVFQQTEEDLGAIEVEENFFHYNDPLTYYGYAYGTTDALGDGYSTLLDKTRLTCKKLSPLQFSTAYTAVTGASSRLVKTSLIVKKGKKKLKKNAVIKLKKGKKLKLHVSASPSSYKVKYSSSAKKYVSVTQKGVLKAKKITPKKGKKKTVLITMKFQNRSFKIKVRVTKPPKKKKGKKSKKG